MRLGTTARSLCEGRRTVHWGCPHLFHERAGPKKTLGVNIDELIHRTRAAAVTDPFATCETLSESI